VALLAIPDHRHATTYWSPYQKLVVQPIYRNGQMETYSLTTNDSLYQTILNLSPAFVESHPEEFGRHPVEWNSYNMPYHFYPAPPSVLVLGSGMGNDVAAALRNGASRVVAVEIDPLILQLGRELHFEHPYQDPRTHVVLDDARSYIQNSHEQFHLIVFSLLDSHTTTSHFTNIRIDNYVYTREALQRAKRLLKSDGLFIVKFQVDNPWIAGRLFNLMQDAFGQDPIQFQSELGGYDASGRFFVGGSRERLAQAMSDPALAAYLATHSKMPTQAARLTTDDWPYFYQHEPGLPISVILISLAVLIICGWFLRQTSGERAGGELHFLFLGAGFMLLEAQIVSKMALLFGTTWVVNAIVISGLLCLIVAANLVYGALPRIPLWIAYAGLFTTLAVMFAVPVEKLFFVSWLVRAIVATLALCVPVFFAGIIFVSSFARAGFRGSALGSNLFGSLLGGLLESFSLWFGLRSLAILAATLYVLSAIFLRRVGTGSDRVSTTTPIRS
jgi:SAM-dependent methyltransferase